MQVDSAALPASELSTPATGGTRERVVSPKVVWRMLRVLQFDRSVYPEVESDSNGTRQAAAIVAIVGIATVLGTVLLGNWHPGAIAGAVSGALIHWLLWSGLEHLTGTLLFRTNASFRSSVRALGLAQTPQSLALFAFVPIAGSWIVVASRLMTLVAGSQAIAATFQVRRRQALTIRLVSFGIALGVAAFVRAALGDVPFLTALLRP